MQQDVQQDIDDALANLEALTRMGARASFRSIRRFKKLSPKQLAPLADLAAKARAYNNGAHRHHWNRRKKATEREMDFRPVGRTGKDKDGHVRTLCPWTLA